MLRSIIIAFVLAANHALAEDLKSQLLKNAAADVKKEQVSALIILDGALERLRSAYKVPATSLSEKYEQWKKVHNTFAAQIENAAGRIKTLGEIADDLFEEWHREAATISEPTLQSRSLAKLTETKRRFSEVGENLAAWRSKAEAISTQFKDRVLFIKHNLNSESFKVLEDESKDIQDDIENLMDDMQNTLPALDDFIRTLS